MTSEVHPHVAIKASAGAGKTFQLTNRYLQLLARNVPPEQILATTFTRKAAGEILDRLLERLAKACADSTAREELSAAIGHTLSGSRCLQLLGNLVSNLHCLQICTLDAFFFRIASTFALEIGLTPGWKIIDEYQEARLREDAIRILLENEDHEQLARLLRRLLPHGEVSRSVSAQLEQKIAKLYGLFLETEANAWGALPVPEPLDDGALERALGVLESTVQGLDVSKALREKVQVDVEKARAGDLVELLSKGPAAKVARGEEKFNRATLPSELLIAYEPLIDHVRSLVIGQLVERTAALRDLLHRFDTARKTLEATRDVLGFADITRSLQTDVLSDRLDEIYFRLDGRVQHLLLDEFQDTSLAQWSVLAPIVEEVCAHGDGSRTLFCVGDTKQAIYGWRGGSAILLDELAAREGVRGEPLDCSYRSAQPIIDTVNTVFTRLARHEKASGEHAAGVRRWLARFQEHSTAKKLLRGYARLETGPVADGTPAQHAATCRHAARVVADLFSNPATRIGVLVRDNATVARMIYELRQLDVAASEEGGVRLIDSPAVTCVLAALRIADHPGDTTSLFQLATSPLGEALELPRSARFDSSTAISSSRRLASRLRRKLVEDGYGHTVAELAGAMAPACDERSWGRLLRLTELAHRHDSAATLRPIDFVALVEQTKVEEPSSMRVRVMTLHQSKGLEFDAVVLPQLDQSLTGHTPDVLTLRESATSPISSVSVYFPTARAATCKQLAPLHEAYREERLQDPLSLLYVGLTRARHALYLVIAPSKPNEKTMPFSYAGLLRTSLVDSTDRVPPTTVLHEHGDPRWHAGVAPTKEPATPEILQEPRFAEASRRRRFERVTPSSLEREGSHPESTGVSAEARLRPQDDAALRRGSFLHACFEEVAWSGDPAPSREQLAERGSCLAIPSATVSTLIDEFYAALEHPTVRSALSHEQYEAADASHVELERERRFACLVNGQLLQGTFDRLAVVHVGGRPHSADLIDFKTDRVELGEDDRLDELVERYRGQLEAYRSAVAHLKGLEPNAISARLLFVGARIIRELD